MENSDQDRGKHKRKGIEWHQILVSYLKQLLLQDNIIQEIVQQFQIKEYQKDDYFAFIGRQCDKIGFVIEGEKAVELKRAYKKGPVYLNLKFFRGTLLTIRRLMDDKQRSDTCVPRSRMKSLRA